MVQVLNKYKDNIPNNAVYIGRGSPYGNPYIIGIHGNRKEVIEKYKIYLFNNNELLMKVKTELVGKDLVCFCKPKSCHGDILLSVANSIILELIC